jgi:hypothetical protein
MSENADEYSLGDKVSLLVKVICNADPTPGNLVKLSLKTGSFFPPLAELEMRIAGDIAA